MTALLLAAVALGVGSTVGAAYEYWRRGGTRTMRHALWRAVGAAEALHAELDVMALERDYLAARVAGCDPLDALAVAEEKAVWRQLAEQLSDLDTGEAL